MPRSWASTSAASRQMRSSCSWMSSKSVHMPLLMPSTRRVKSKGRMQAVLICWEFCSLLS